MANETRRDNPGFQERGEQIRTGAANLGSSASSAARNVGNQAQDLASNIGNKASNLAEQMGTTFEDARQRINEAKDVVVDKTKVAAKATDEYVTSNPWKAVGIASGIALVVGMMLRRR